MRTKDPEGHRVELDVILKREDQRPVELAVRTIPDHDWFSSLEDEV
jgi:hypothetical protein